MKLGYNFHACSGKTGSVLQVGKMCSALSLCSHHSSPAKVDKKHIKRQKAHSPAQWLFSESCSILAGPSRQLLNGQGSTSIRERHSEDLENQQAAVDIRHPVIARLLSSAMISRKSKSMAHRVQSPDCALAKKRGRPRKTLHQTGPEEETRADNARPGCGIQGQDIVRKVLAAAKKRQQTRASLGGSEPCGGVETPSEGSHPQGRGERVLDAREDTVCNRALPEELADLQPARQAGITVPRPGDHREAAQSSHRTGNSSGVSVVEVANGPMNGKDRQSHGNTQGFLRRHATLPLEEMDTCLGHRVQNGAQPQLASTGPGQLDAKVLQGILNSCNEGEGTRCCIC